MPAALVVAVCVCPVPLFFRVTVASGTTALDGSVMIPVTSPDTSDCPAAEILKIPASSTIRVAKIVRLTCIVHPSELKFQGKACKLWASGVLDSDDENKRG